MIVSIINFTGFGMVTPIIPGWAYSQLGASLTIAGVIAALFSAVALVARPITSVMGDRLNKKYLLAVALTLNGITTLLYAFVPSLLWVIPVRALHGFFFSVSGTIAFALGADYVPKKRMGEGVGYMGMGQIIGMAIGPNIGIFVIERYSYQLCFLVSGAAIVLAGFSVCALRYSKNARISYEISNKVSIKLRDLVAVELLPNVLFVSLFMLCNGLIVSFLTMIGELRSIAGIGTFFVVNSVAVLIARPIIGRITDNKGVKYAVVPGYILTAIAMVLIGSGYSIVFIIAAAILFALGAGSSMPAIQADCLMRLDKTRSTVATGTYMIGLDIGMIVGPMLGGLMADFYGFQATFNSAGILMLVGFFAYLIYTKNRRMENERFKRKAFLSQG